MKRKKPLKEESRSIGNFGESLLSFFLVKNGVNVVESDAAVFDLFVKDHEKRLFPTSKLIGISVKTRSRLPPHGSSTTIPFPFKNIPLASKIWNLEPYLSCILITKKKLECFIFPFTIANGLVSSQKRKNAISISKLRKSEDKRIIKFEWDIKW